MASASFRFDRFLLDPRDRRLQRDGQPVDVNGRYLDALALLVGERGKLVTKDRFMDEVWRGVPVTDEALTQCIKTLRRQLGDNAANPRFIETVPKHGYRFIAPVETVEGEASRPALATESPVGTASARRDWRPFLMFALGGTMGGGVAGLIGGLFYGFAGASQPLEPGLGAISVLLVLTCLTVAVALMGAAGVCLGIAVANIVSGGLGAWCILGGAAGGMIVGGLVKLLGIDAFNLLLGRSPGDITGAAEGTLLGAAIGLGVWLANRGTPTLLLRRSAIVASLIGGATGMLIVLMGGRLMGGSLDLLAHSFPASRLRLDQIGALLGEPGFGPVSQVVTGGLEGALFAGCVVGATVLARRWLGGDAQQG